MRSFLLLLLTFTVAGCASQILDSYVGKSIAEPILDYGPPTNILELGDGKRAYQWAMTNSGVIPMTSPASATVYGSGGYATAYGTSTSYIPYSNDCVYTLLASQKGKDWLVDGFRRPTMGCE